MSEFVYPFGDQAVYGYSDADRAEIELLADAVQDTEVVVLADPNPNQLRRNVVLEPEQVATDTLWPLDEMR